MTNPIVTECRMADERAGPLPQPPPDLAQAIAAMLTGRDEQTALLRRLVEQGAAPRPGHHHPPPVPGYQKFLGTQPPLFHKADEPLEADRADEPLEADSWLKTIESKFSPCIHTTTMTRLHLQLSSFEVPHVRGGIIMWLFFLLVLGFLGRSSKRLSGHIIFLLELFEGSLLSFWL